MKRLICPTLAIFTVLCGRLITYKELATDDHNQTDWRGVKDEQIFKEIFATVKK